MKKFFLLILSFVAVSGLLAQKETIHPSRIVKATYMDKTLPLRDMPIILPGQRDRSWKDGVIENPSLEPTLSEEQKAYFATVEDPVAQRYMGTSGQRGPVHSFKGIGNVNGVYPPDTDGEAGPDHFFQMINLSFAIWDKQGNKLYGPVDNSTLWAGFIGPWTGTNDGDPVILYDHLADRWVASQFAIHSSNGSYWELVAVSATGDPLGEYYRYAFEFPAFNDYPKLSVWPDGYYATFNMFGGDVRGAVASFEREKMLAGDPGAQMVYFDMWGTFSLLPSDVEGPAPPEGSPNFVAHRNVWGNQNLEIYEFLVDWSNPDNSTITQVADLVTQPYNPDVGGIPQPGTSVLLDDLAMMLMYRLSYRNFTDYEVLLTNHTVKVDGHAGVRWYELRKEEGDWYIYQQGTYAPDDEHRWMGSIAMNGAGEIALGYTVSSSTTSPSIRYTGRSPFAPLGEMNFTEIELVGGSGAQTVLDRWGDYSCMTVDPADDNTFWYTQEYLEGAWKTRICSFDFGPIMPPQINAGPADTIICQSDPYMAHSTGTYVYSVLWTTDGDGMFVPQPPVNLSQGYVRGPQDIINGGFNLYVTATGFEPGLQADDSIYVAITRWPTCNAGADSTICYYNSITLNGTAADASEVLWSTGGDGTFDDPSLLYAAYTPGPTDLAQGWVNLTLTAIPLFPCEDNESDVVRITFDPCTGIEDNTGANFMIRIVPNPSDGRFQIQADGLLFGNYQLNVQNSLGEVIFTKTGSTQTGSVRETIIMSYLTKGTYFLELKSGPSSRIEKLILQ
jgi:hypothetical protein